MHLNKNKEFIIYLIACSLILLPLLYFPLSGDLALFLSSIRIIDAGGLPYVDLIDIKPPLLFYLFRAITRVFGTGEYGIRLFDYIIQIITISLLYLVILRATNKKLPAILSGIFYSFAYVTMSFNNTTQIESLLGICLLPLIYAQVFKREKLILFFPIAFIVGIFTGMKYTLGIILAAQLLDDTVFASLSIRTIIKKYSIIFAGFTSAFIIGLIPYINSSILTGFKEMSEYFSFYASQPHIDFASIKYMLSSLSLYFGDIQSMLLFGLFLCGAGYMLKNIKDKSAQSDMLRIAFLILIALLFACFVERKLFIYHLSRMNSVFAIFWAIGAFSLIKFIKSNNILRDRFGIFVCSAFILFFIPLSPIPRWTQLILLPKYFYTNQSEYDQKFEREGSESILRVQHKKVAEYINTRIDSNSMVINASTGSSMLNYLFNTNKLSKFCQSSYYVFPNAIDKHINGFTEELEAAEFIVIHTNDRYLYINGTQSSTYESIQQNPKIWNTLNLLFKCDTVIGNFKIYKKINIK